MTRWLLVVVLLGCGSKTPPLQSHDLPNKQQGTTVYEPKCADNPPSPCRKQDLQCTLDDGRGCYVCQCQMAGDEPPDAIPTSRPPE